MIYQLLKDNYNLKRHLNGIQLISSDNTVAGIAVKKLLDLPFCVYFYEGTQLVAASNEINANQSGFSANEVIGLSLKQILSPQCANQLAATHQAIIDSKQMRILEEQSEWSVNDFAAGLSVKYPWYDKNNNVIGVFGCSSSHKQFQHPGEFLNSLWELGLINHWPQVSANINNKLNHLNLTKREKEIIAELVRERSAKRIAANIKISHRTVEKHIENIKSKIGVSSKQEIIDSFKE